MVKTILITRHGFRANWVLDKPVPEPPTGIDGDTVLADHGLDQADELAAFLSKPSKDIPAIDRIYSSPFYRCLQTATPLAKRLGVDIYAENGVGEWYQRTRPNKPIPAKPAELAKYFPSLKVDYVPLVVASPDGETVDEIHDRAELLVSKLTASLEDSSVDTILIVTHAATKIALGRALVGDRSVDIRTGTCSIDKYVVQPGTSGGPGDWQLVFTGKTDFLSQGEEMHWTFQNAYEAGSDQDIAARKLAAEAAAAKTAQDADETVSVYVPLDLSMPWVAAGRNTSTSIRPNASFQMTSLDSANPLFNIGDTVYEGNWQQMVGTEVYTTTEGEYLAKSRERIQLRPVELQSTTDGSATKTYSSSALVDRVRSITEARKGQDQVMSDD